MWPPRRIQVKGLVWGDCQRTKGEIICLPPSCFNGRILNATTSTTLFLKQVQACFFFLEPEQVELAFSSNPVTLNEQSSNAERRNYLLVSLVHKVNSDLAHYTVPINPFKALLKFNQDHLHQNVPTFSWCFSVLTPMFLLFVLTQPYQI